MYVCLFDSHLYLDIVFDANLVAPEDISGFGEGKKEEISLQTLPRRSPRLAAKKLVNTSRFWFYWFLCFSFCCSKAFVVVKLFTSFIPNE